MLTPYDFQENLQQRAQYIRNRLQAGSPVVGLSYDNGVMLVSVRRRGRKVFEIYDRLIFAGIGNQSDVETMRIAAVDFTHQEGFIRSPDDVTIQRVVGFALSPALKKAFGDPFTAPFVFRGLFAELGATPEQDLFYLLNYDGEFLQANNYAVLAGTNLAEENALDYLESQISGVPSFESAVPIALTAWGIAQHSATQEETESVSETTARTTLREALGDGTVEIGLLERETLRENRFRLVSTEQLEPLLRRLG
ncbi:MAG: hypothetical protein SNJ72_03155 [Fimbriimonadales bacterium]